ncbi:hypothetical protein AVEN_19939-1 [Araneus ventricosus]|uniref:Uncharacterized protein n=1 Tax=Araneus ventricosus TaxID=182803 RepID=A0A4Y2V8E2_ARAVE|nr:hypothetical protein AVEN_19939-1 [Araneus ventricosus]
MQEKSESLMRQDRVCRSGESIFFHPRRRMSSFMSLAVWGLALSSKNKTSRDLLPFLKTCDQREVLRHPSSPFSCIEVSTIGTSLTKQ